MTIDGQAWDITTVSGTYEVHKELLSEQPWFGHKTLAVEFMAATYGMTFDGLPRYGLNGYPNYYGNKGVYFAYVDEVRSDGRTVSAGDAYINSSTEGCSIDGSHGFTCAY